MAGLSGQCRTYMDHGSTVYTCCMDIDTLKPVLKDHCHERPPVLKDHAYIPGKRSHISMQMKLSPKPTCLERPYFHC